MRSRPLYDAVALAARLAVGGVFIAHGWQKIQVGITATARQFDALGVPAPTPAAIYATFAELLGGIALILGIGLPVAGLLLFLDMAGALAFVHAGNGLFVVDQGRVRNGFELVLTLGMASALFAAGGAGRLTLDHRLSGRRRVPDDEAEAEAWAATVTGKGEAPGEGEAPGSSAAGRNKGAGAVSAASDASDEADASEPAGAAATRPRPRPRPAAEIVGDTSQDTLVAGGRKSRGRRKSSGDAPAPADEAGTGGATT